MSATSALVALIGKFKRLARLDVGESLEPVHAVLLQYASEQFDTAGRAGGQPWADYSAEPKYRAYKRAVGADMRPLRWQPGRRERLAPSLTDPRDADHVWSLTGGVASMGSALPYAARIEQGGENKFGELAPPRPILPDTGALRRAVTKAVLGDLVKSVARKTGLVPQKR